MRWFTTKELCRSNVAELRGVANVPNLGQLRNMVKLVENVLDPIREKWGGPITVNSGFRCEELNRLVGGARNSEHLSGRAADITVGSKAANRRLFGLILELGEKGEIEWRQLINENGYSWIHISYNEGDNGKQVLSL